MATEPLQHLTDKSASVGAWMVAIAMEPKEVTFTWNKNGKSGTGRKLECLLVSDDSTQYCEGLCRRQGKEPKANQDFDAMKQKFQKGTIWKISKVSLAKQANKYLGCSCKIVIDMNATTFQAVLQSTVKMPIQATPPEDLSTLLQCPEGQFVDVLALVKDVSEVKEVETQYGSRQVVDVTIMDDSGKSGASMCTFAAWFPKQSMRGQCQQLKELIESASTQKPVAFFNLVCTKEQTTTGASEHGGGTKTTIKTNKDKLDSEICDLGAKARRLENVAGWSVETHGGQITVVSEKPNFTAKSEIDYLNIDRPILYASCSVTCSPLVVLQDTPAVVLQSMHTAITLRCFRSTMLVSWSPRPAISL